jgi:hypothetical protein
VTDDAPRRAAKAGATKVPAARSLRMGDLRQASAFLDGDDPVFVKVGTRHAEATRAWPDTQSAPMGRGLYVYVEVAEPADGTTPSRDPSYEGHDIHLTNTEAIWSVGRTPEEAVAAFCVARFGGAPERTVESTSPARTGTHTWWCDFRCGGADHRGAGITVPGGAIMTWWDLLP